MMVASSESSIYEENSSDDDGFMSSQSDDDLAQSTDIVTSVKAVKTSMKKVGKSNCLLRPADVTAWSGGSFA
jgi:hypothetical protein